MSTLQVDRTSPRASGERYPDCPVHVEQDFFADRRWAWSSGPCRAGEHHFEVHVEADHQLGDQLRPVTTALRDHTVRPASRYRVVRRQSELLPYGVYHERSRVALAKDPATLLRFLTWHINRTMIRTTSAGHVVLHAAAAQRAGVTVVLPGDQERGKTTTIAGLLRAGYDYVTDEAVAVDPDSLLITPFPKALSIDDGSWPMFPEARPPGPDQGLRQWQVPAERLGSRGAEGPVAPPRIIVFPRFVAGSATRLVPMTRASAVRELVGTTFLFQDHPARNLRTAAALTQSATVARLQIGSLEEAILAVEQLVSETLMEAM